MGKYVSYPTGTAFGALQCQLAEPIAAGGANVTIRVRNNTGKIITLIAAHGFSSTANAQAGTSIDIQNAATASHLTAVINMQTGNQVNVAAGINGVGVAAGNTIATGVDAYFVFANAAGGGATVMTNAQATLYYTCEFAST